MGSAIPPAGPEVRRGGGLPFGQFVSRWVCDPRYSPNAIRVYTVLVTYADVTSKSTEKGRPYLKEIARQSSLSVSATRSALAELVIAGIVTVTERKNPKDPRFNDSNLYELHDAEALCFQWIDPLPEELKARKALELGGYLSSKGGLMSLPDGPYRGPGSRRGGERSASEGGSGKPEGVIREAEEGGSGTPEEGVRGPEGQEVKSLFHSLIENPPLSPGAPDVAAGGARGAEREAAAPSKTSLPDASSDLPWLRRAGGGSTSMAPQGSTGGEDSSLVRSLPSAGSAPEEGTVPRQGGAQAGRAPASLQGAAERCGDAWVESRMARGLSVPPVARARVVAYSLLALKEFSEDWVLDACRDMGRQKRLLKDPLRHLEHYNPPSRSSGAGSSASGSPGAASAAGSRCRDMDCQTCFGSGWFEDENRMMVRCLVVG